MGAAPSLGLELELVPVEVASGDSHPVGEAYFTALATHLGAASLEVAPPLSPAAGLSTPAAVYGIDNGFNLLETALAPQPGGPDALTRLAGAAAHAVDACAAALAAEGAALVNLAQHPWAARDAATYARLRAPRAIYDYLTGYRGWDHAAGIDAKAQNGPTTGLEPERAVRVLNVLLAAGPAFAALFANSPFEDGAPSGWKETRLTLWPRMVAGSRFPADRARVALPERPFRDLADYFTWTFGPGTAMQAVPAAGGYKDGALVRAAGDPPLLAFLAANRWAVHPLGPDGAAGPPQVLAPDLAHLEALQWSNFLDARLRFAFARPLPPPAAFLAALTTPGGVEAFFRAHGANLYVEARVPGCTLPDRDLMNLADASVARSVLVSASAVQLGLIANLDQAERRLLGGWTWDEIRALRAVAPRDALAGEAGGRRVDELCRVVLELAADGLSARETWMLAYPWRVLTSGLTGADRALAAFAAAPGRDDRDRLRRVVAGRLLAREALRPSAPEGGDHA